MGDSASWKTSHLKVLVPNQLFSPPFRIDKHIFYYRPPSFYLAKQGDNALGSIRLFHANFMPKPLELFNDPFKKPLRFLISK